MACRHVHGRQCDHTVFTYLLQIVRMKCVNATCNATLADSEAERAHYRRRAARFVTRRSDPCSCKQTAEFNMRQWRFANYPLLWRQKIIVFVIITVVLRRYLVLSSSSVHNRRNCVRHYKYLLYINNSVSIRPIIYSYHLF